MSVGQLPVLVRLLEISDGGFVDLLEVLESAFSDLVDLFVLFGIKAEDLANVLPRSHLCKGL